MNLINQSPAAPTAPPPRRLWALPVFQKLFVGDAAARVGYQVTLFLLPLLVVTRLHGSGSQAGLVSGSQFVPVLLFSLGAGVLADRAPTRRLILAGTLARGAALGALGLMCALTGVTFWALLATAFVVGTGSVVYDVGYQAGIPSLLRPEELTRGNALLQSSNSVSQMAGPALAGVLVQQVGLPLSLTLATALFVGAFAAFWLLPLEQGLASDDTGAGSRGGAGGRATAGRGRSALAGLRFTLGCRPLRDLCVQSGLFNLHEEAFLTAFLVYGVRAAHLTAGTIGLLIGFGSIGTLLGSAAAGRLADRRHAGRSLVVGLVGASAGFLIGPLLSSHVPTIPLYGTAFLLNGFALGQYNVYAVSMRQAIPPKRFLGSATAGYRLVSLGLAPVGSLLGGWLADRLTAGSALYVIAVSMTVTSLLILASPIRRIRRVEDASALGGRHHDDDSD
ncbi:MFS-type transporter involved in bile tolerance, Atg22 family [Streptacidiphilus jiangxiensis]|uniref:MFS-type transporter involved in bile tolerance, Atg22 family n=1 Tax=Streptacidiphilus jiangxiensis TaxID=235985 RepID=A0A1H7ZE26_STRJI|nr:MFS-type transporter involved in bile tolerance, Atg22 family [Streptacidiphilus jiangxiensis]